MGVAQKHTPKGNLGTYIALWHASMAMKPRLECIFIRTFCMHEAFVYTIMSELYDVFLRSCAMISEIIMFF